jgi:hypothetical protein
MKLPAEAIMVSGQDVVCNESDMTGEPKGEIKVNVDEDNVDEGVKNTLFARAVV